MSFMDRFRKKSSVPFHFEIHGDDYFIELKSELDKSKVFDMFFKGVKRLRKKSDISSMEDMPEFYKADAKQLKALESVVVNKRFLEDISKQVRKDVPSFKIINSELGELTFTLINLDKYEQKIMLKGVCYYEE